MSDITPIDVWHQTYRLLLKQGYDVDKAADAADEGMRRFEQAQVSEKSPQEKFGDDGRDSEGKSGAESLGPLALAGVEDPTSEARLEMARETLDELQPTEVIDLLGKLRL